MAGDARSDDVSRLPRGRIAAIAVALVVVVAAATFAVVNRDDGTAQKTAFGSSPTAAPRTPQRTLSAGPTSTGATPDLAFSASPTPVTAGSATPSASPSDSRRLIRVGTEAVAGVRIGTPAEVAERQLRQALGVPVVREYLCDSFQRRTLSWGALTVYLEPHKARGARVLEGWVVEQGRSRFRYTLPYDIQPRTRMRDVLQRVPDAEGYAVDEGEFTGSYFVKTRRQADLFWMSEQRDGSGVVNEIHFGATGCD